VKVGASKTGLTINGQEFAGAADELVDAAPVAPLELTRRRSGVSSPASRGQRRGKGIHLRRTLLLEGAE
jgi:hypothetical protein